MKPLRLLLLGQLHLLVLMGAENHADQPDLPKEVVGYLRSSQFTEQNADFSLVTNPNGPKAEVKALVTQTKDGHPEKTLVTLIRTASGYRIKERTRLYDGATPADVEPVRAAILLSRQADSQKATQALPKQTGLKAPTDDDTLISSLTKTKVGLAATFETDQRAMSGSGADVQLSRWGDGSLPLTATKGFKK